MPTPPKGAIVARPMEARACGCLQEFQHYEVDKFRAQRLAKFQRTHCPACAAKRVAQQQQAAPLFKGEALRRLGPGAQLTLTLRQDGAWAGTLTAAGTTVETTGATGAGPQAVVDALARLWLVAQVEPKP